MKWIKKGHIFKPTSEFAWSQEFAQVPTPIELTDRIRIFYTTRPIPRNGISISETSFIDVEKDDPSNIIYTHNEPSLKLGDIGTFDEFGIHPVTLIKNNDEIWLYYQGWTRMSSVPYSTSLGLAISYDNALNFKKIGDGPIMSRTYKEPFLENGFFIKKNKSHYKMWYATCRQWIKVGNKYEPVYNIVDADSSDGINWNRKAIQLFDNKYKYEASGRPTVIEINGKYHMWFCYRDVLSFRGRTQGAYKIGYAYSNDLINWIRNDDSSGIKLSKSGWDSQMQAYPYVIKVNNKYFMFYCGNNFGKEGFGYAELTAI